MKALFRWVGGKRWLAPKLSIRIRKYLTGHYYEPFVGSGAVFFHLEPNQAHIADSLEALTATYRAIKQDPIKVWHFVNSISKESDSIEHYNLYRDRLNALLSHGRYDEEFAALFIYMNCAGFNGLWRQNSEGEFNVPYGEHTSLKIPSFGHLLEVGRLLKTTTIHTVSSSKETLALINQAKSGDVVYADPPYMHAYQGYDGLIESDKEFQEELAIVLWQAVRRGVVVFVTNNDCPEIRRWYGAFASIETYNRSQSMAGTVDGRKRWNQILAVGLP